MTFHVENSTANSSGGAVLVSKYVRNFYLSTANSIHILKYFVASVSFQMHCCISSLDAPLASALSSAVRML